MRLIVSKVLLVSSLLISQVFSEKCVLSAWAPFADKKFNFGTRKEIFPSPTVSHCLNKCFQTFGCVAWNFGPRSSTYSECELFDITRHYKMPNFIVSQNWTYIEREVSQDKSIETRTLNEFCVCSRAVISHLIGGVYSYIPLCPTNFFY